MTRDGTGAGFLEVDTAIASKVDAVYLVDVAVAALLLVAHSDDQFAFVEAFEPPPIVGSLAGSVTSKHNRRSSRSSRVSRSSKRDSKREERERQKELSKKPAKSRMEQFEMDIESQTSELGKMDKVYKAASHSLGDPRHLAIPEMIAVKALNPNVTHQIKHLKTTVSREIKPRARPGTFSLSPLSILPSSLV